MTTTYYYRHRIDLVRVVGLWEGHITLRGGQKLKTVGHLTKESALGMSRALIAHTRGFKGTAQR